MLQPHHQRTTRSTSASKLGSQLVPKKGTSSRVNVRFQGIYEPCFDSSAFPGAIFLGEGNFGICVHTCTKIKGLSGAFGTKMECVVSKCMSRWQAMSEKQRWTTLVAGTGACLLIWRRRRSPPRAQARQSHVFAPRQRWTHSMVSRGRGKHGMSRRAPKFAATPTVC